MAKCYTFSALANKKNLEYDRTQNTVLYKSPLDLLKSPVVE